MAALTVRRLPGPDQLAPGTQNPVAGLRDRERGELVTTLQTAQVTGVIPRQAAQPGQGKPALVPGVRAAPSPSGAQLTAPGSALAVSVPSASPMTSARGWPVFPAGTIREGSALPP